MATARKQSTVIGGRKGKGAKTSENELKTSAQMKANKVSSRHFMLNSTYIRKRGNSAGVNIPTKALAVSGFDVDTEVSVEAHEGEIIIKAVKSEITLESLLSESPEAKLKQSNLDATWFNDEPLGLEMI